MVDRVGFNPPSFGGDQPPERPVRFGANEMEAEDQFVRVERREKVAEAVERKQMEMPWFDYIPHRFNAEDAAEFAKTPYGPPGVDAEITGQEFLNLLVTPGAIDPQDLPQEPERLHYADYGVAESEIRQRLIDKGLPNYFYEDLLRLAHRDGLIYRLVDRENERTYYGVPQDVRAALDLEVQEKLPMAEVSTETGRGEKEAFTSGLLAYSKKAESVNDPELMEYVAQLLQSARKAGLIEFEQIPESFRAIDVDPDFIPGVGNALMTLMVSTPGTELYDETKKLTQKAVLAGLIDPDEYELAS